MEAEHHPGSSTSTPAVDNRGTQSRIKSILRVDSIGQPSKSNRVPVNGRRSRSTGESLEPEFRKVPRLACSGIVPPGKSPCPGNSLPGNEEAGNTNSVAEGNPRTLSERRHSGDDNSDNIGSSRNPLGLPQHQDAVTNENLDPLSQPGNQEPKNTNEGAQGCPERDADLTRDDRDEEQQQPDNQPPVQPQEDEEPFSVFTLYRRNYAQNEQLAREAPRKIKRRKFPAPDTTLTEGPSSDDEADSDEWMYGKFYRSCAVCRYIKNRWDNHLVCWKCRPTPLCTPQETCKTCAKWPKSRWSAAWTFFNQLKMKFFDDVMQLRGNPPGDRIKRVYDSSDALRDWFMSERKANSEST